MPTTTTVRCFACGVDFPCTDGRRKYCSAPACKKDRARPRGAVPAPALVYCRCVVCGTVHLAAFKPKVYTCPSARCSSYKKTMDGFIRRGVYTLPLHCWTCNAVFTPAYVNQAYCPNHVETRNR